MPWHSDGGYNPATETVMLGGLNQLVQDIMGVTFTVAGMSHDHDFGCIRGKHAGEIRRVIWDLTREAHDASLERFPRELMPTTTVGVADLVAQSATRIAEHNGSTDGGAVAAEYLLFNMHAKLHDRRAKVVPFSLFALAAAIEEGYDVLLATSPENPSLIVERSARLDAICTEYVSKTRGTPTFFIPCTPEQLLLTRGLKGDTLTGADVAIILQLQDMFEKDGRRIRPEDEYAQIRDAVRAKYDALVTAVTTIVNACGTEVSEVKIGAMIPTFPPDTKIKVSVAQAGSGFAIIFEPATKTRNRGRGGIMEMLASLVGIRDNEEEGVGVG